MGVARYFRCAANVHRQRPSDSAEIEVCEGTGTVLDDLYCFAVHHSMNVCVSDDPEIVVGRSQNQWYVAAEKHTDLVASFHARRSQSSRSLDNDRP